MKIDRLLTSFEQMNSTPAKRLTTSFMIIMMLILGYVLLNNHLAHKIDLLLPIDEHIPYWPWSVGIYITLHPMYLVAAWTLSPRRYVHVLLGITTMTLISFVFFTVMTSHYPRPSPEAWAHSTWKPVIDLLVAVDAPGNTCPSLHVSTSLYLGWILKDRKYGLGWLVWGVLLSLSTLTLKQHYVWDWIGGSVLARLILWVQTHFGAFNMNTSVQEYDG